MADVSVTTCPRTSLDMEFKRKLSTTATPFPTALAGLLLEVPTALAVSIVPDPGVRLVCSVEAVAASIQHLEEVPTASMALPMPVPTAVAM
jgi:hypothetical protein